MPGGVRVCMCVYECVCMCICAFECECVCVLNGNIFLPVLVFPILFQDAWCACTCARVCFCVCVYASKRATM